ncbi:MAG TPA: hypothetical protein VNI02_08835 [Blastocatellia bacterium]|jgi:hypothetical protein|nr:hypothetical protein [Blastocatellia bacterium]
MSDGLVELKDRISQMSDDELLRIVEVEYDDYRHEAVDFAKAELDKRNIPYDAHRPAPEGAGESEGSGRRAAISQASDKGVAAVGNLRCGFCGGAVRSGLIFADKELSIFFPDKNEERFVQALACGACGELRLVVDFETDVEE